MFISMASQTRANLTRDQRMESEIRHLTIMIHSHLTQPHSLRNSELHLTPHCSDIPFGVD